MGSLLLLAVGILGLVRFRQLQSGLRYLVGLVWFGLAVQLAAGKVAELFSSNNFLFPFWFAGFVGLLTLVYHRGLPAGRPRQLMSVIAGAYVAYALFRGIFLFKLIGLHPGLQVGANLVLLGLVGVYFQNLLQELRAQPLRHDPLFWVSVGVLVFALGDLLIGLFSNYVLTHYSAAFFRNMWAGHNLLSIVLYLCYGLALWMRPRK